MECVVSFGFREVPSTDRNPSFVEFTLFTINELGVYGKVKIYEIIRNNGSFT